MTLNNIDAVEVLIEHGKHLLASMDYVHTRVLKNSKSVLNQKQTVELIKAIREGKSMDSSKFPNLPKKDIEAAGKELRHSFVILSHYRDFQSKAQRLFVDIYNECKNFDLSWNYIFTFSVCRLFTIYVKLAVLVTQMNDVGRIPIVYDYCYRRITENPEAQPSELITFFKERVTFIKLTSELQLLQSKMYGLFKGIVSIMYHLLTAGLSYNWSYLNVSDNPSEFDEGEREFPFFQPEYVVMMHLEELCDCFVSYIIANYGAITADPLFLDVLMLIIAHNPNYQIHGTTSFNTFKILEEIRKFRNKKSESGYLLSEKVNELTKNHIPTRYYRCRKLTMILEEFINCYSVSKDILSSKFVIIYAALGFAHHTATSLLNTYHTDNRSYDDKHKMTDIVPLLYRMTQIVSLILKHIDDVNRFIIYNLHEYDAPFLQHMIQSFNIPTSDYNRFVVIYNALMELNIEEYDKGQRYELTGLEMTLKRIMGSFNKFSTTHGVLHLAPLFNLLSAMFFRVKFFNNSALFFKEVCPIQEYWRYMALFNEIADLKETPNACFFPAILMLTHFYAVDKETILEFKDFKSMITTHVDIVIQQITNTIFYWAHSLQTDGLQQLLDQTSVTKVLTKNGIYEKVNKKLPIGETKPGDESILKSRQQLSPIHSKLTLISETFVVFREIGQLSLFGETMDLFDKMNKNLATVMVKLFDSDKVQTPFRLMQMLQNTRFIITYIMTAARIDPGPVIYDMMTKLTNAPIEEKDGIVVINREKLGKMADKYVNFYAKFLKRTIADSFYSTNSQSFFTSKNEKKDNNFKADIIQVFASKSAIRTIHEILTISGIACIDIVAADAMVKLYEDFSECVKDCTKGNTAQFVNDPFNLPKAKDIFDIITHIGAICKFRQLLRTTIPQEEAVGQYAFLSNKTTPETDTILISRIKNLPIIDQFKDEKLLPSLFRALFCSPVLGNTSEYSSQNDAFTKNYHLIGLGIDAVVGAIISQSSDFDYEMFYTNIVTNIYDGINIGKANIETKEVKAWDSKLLYIILDHFAKISYYLDYSILEPILPYHLIRSIYTRLLHKK